MFRSGKILIVRGQCVESGKRRWVACEQVAPGFLPHVRVRNQLVIRFVQTGDELAHGTLCLGSGEQDIRIQEYPHLTPPLALGIELGRQLRLRFVELLHSLIGVDLDRQGNGRAQQHSVRRRFGYHQVVTR